MRNLTAAASCSRCCCPSVALAAPEALRCKAKFDPAKPDAEPRQPGLQRELLRRRGVHPGRHAGGALPPTDLEPNRMRSLVDCADNPVMPGHQGPLQLLRGRRRRPDASAPPMRPPSTRTLELLRAKVPNLPTWERDPVLPGQLQRQDRHPGNSAESGPLFFREQTSDTFVANQRGRRHRAGRAVRGQALRRIHGRRQHRGHGRDPVEDIYEACGAGDVHPRARFSNDATVCPPGSVHLLRCAGAGDRYDLRPVPAHVAGLSTTTMRTVGSRSSRRLKPSSLQGRAPGWGRRAERVWNGLLDLPGSLLGGNTWRPNGDDSLSVGMPPPFEGVSAPYAGKQRPRFHPLDLYVLGLLPWQEVPPIRSFLPRQLRTIDRAHIGLISFYLRASARTMGTRIDGVALRKEEKTADGQHAPEVRPVLPKPIPIVRHRPGQRRRAQSRLRDRPPVHPPAVGR